MILALNSGSSSLKLALFEDATGLPLVLKGSVSSLHGDPHLKVTRDGHVVSDEHLGAPDMDGVTSLERLFGVLRGMGLLSNITAVGHRIVHGGRQFTSPARLDAETLAALHALIPLAPLHQPFGLKLVATAARVLPHVVHVGCFDTAFHASQPKLARMYGLPRELTDDGVIAYGFHGLSYTYIASVLPPYRTASRSSRVIVAHLGNGASLCAMRDGNSVATTMGFSVLDGLVMGTRCGTIDPGVLLHLQRARGLSLDAVTDLLYKRSGLLGVSGMSDDMATLLQSHDERAQEAVDLFVYRVTREIGALAAVLGGLDRLVFTAGIGEHSPEIRARICEQARWLGVVLDDARNASVAGGEAVVISHPRSAVQVLVMETNEEKVVAEAARRWSFPRRGYARDSA